MSSFFFGTTNNDGDYHDREQLTNIVTGCARSNHKENVSHDRDTWVLLQDAHDRVKAKYASDWHLDSRSKAVRGESVPHSGMQIPFAVATNPETNQRQVYATRDIPEGFQVWKPLHYATFKSQHGYLEFLQELPHHLQCDVLEWTHPSYYNNQFYVDVTLDEGTFIQEATLEDQVNIDINCVTLRKIEAGEFVYMNSTSHLAPDSTVEWLEVIQSNAWKRTGLGMGSRSYTAATTTEDDHKILAPGIAALSAMYFCLKLVRRTKESSSSSYNDPYYRGIASFYVYHPEKSKLA